MPEKTVDINVTSETSTSTKKKSVEKVTALSIDVDTYESDQTLTDGGKV